MSVNKVILVGRLGQDPELRYTASGTAVCNLSLATGEFYKDQNGERHEKTEWHRVVVWDRQAENCSKFLNKGSQIFVEGRLQTRSWEDKNGQKRYTTEVTANNVQFLGGNQAGVGAGGERPERRDSQERSIPSSSYGEQNPSDEGSQGPQDLQGTMQGGGGLTAPRKDGDSHFTSEDIPF